MSTFRQATNAFIASFFLAVFFHALDLALINDVKPVTSFSLMENKLTLSKRGKLQSVNQTHLLVDLNVLKQSYLIQVAQVHFSALERTLSDNVFEDVSWHDPAFTVGSSQDCCCTFVVHEQCYLSETNHLGIGRHLLLELDLCWQVGVVRVCALLIDDDCDWSLSQHEVFISNITVADDLVTFLELLLVHRIRKSIMFRLT